MTSRLFWKLFLSFAVTNLISIAGITFLVAHSSAVHRLEISRWDGATQSPPTNATAGVSIPLTTDEPVSLRIVGQGDSAPAPPRDHASSPNAIELTPGHFRLAIAAIPAAASQLWGYATAIFLGLLLVTLKLVGDIVGPVMKLTESAKQMASGHYEHPIYVANRDELGQLAATFNTMRQTMGGNLAKMRDTNQRMATVLGGMNDGVIAIDRHQRVLFANRAAGKLMGFDPATAQGKTLLESVRSHVLRDLVVGVFASHGRQEIEIEWGDVKRRTLLVSATSISAEPSAGILLMIHDLTDELRLESMRRDFVANVSHELKTPLSSIKAYAETLSQGAINDAVNRGRFVREIEEQADRLNQLITDLLSLRIEQNSEPLDMPQIPIRRVAELCVREQQRAANEKNIELRLEPSEEDLIVEADEDGLRQMLINLIDNGIKYTPRDGVVSVAWRRKDDGSEIVVSDTGIGIAEDMQPRVFERFFRVDKARSRELGGTGLGLAIVKHLAQNYGGSVDVASQLGVGSHFTIWLPEPGTIASRQLRR